MANRSKLNWKALDRLIPVLEKEGWTLAMIASDWGISLATLEDHLDRKGESMPGGKPEVYIDWERFDELKAQGLTLPRISDEMGIKFRTLNRHIQRRKKAHPSTPEEHQETPEVHPSTPYEAEVLTGHPGTPEPTEIPPDEQDTQEHLVTPEHPGTLEGHQEVIEEVHQSVPDAPHIGSDEDIPVHPSTPEVHPELSQDDSSMAHHGVPARQDHLISTPMVHPGTPTEEDWMLWTAMKGRWSEIEKMLSDWQTRHTLLSTPSGTPRNTMKKTYVVDTLYIELIDRYAQEQGVELKDVVNLAFHEFFERREFLPQERRTP